MAVNLKFKFMLIEKFGSMSKAAQKTGLAIAVLSRVANGWHRPNAEQRKRLVRRFGREKIEEVLGVDYRKPGSRQGFSTTQGTRQFVPKGETTCETLPIIPAQAGQTPDWTQDNNMIRRIQRTSRQAANREKS